MSTHRDRAIALSISVILYGATAGAGEAIASTGKQNHKSSEPSAALVARQNAQPAADATTAKKHKPKDVTNLNSIAEEAIFTALRGLGAPKMNVADRDTPFSILTYAGSFTHAVDAQKVEALYPCMTGIQSAGTTGYDMAFRGFKSDAAALPRLDSRRRPRGESLPSVKGKQCV